MSDDILLDEVAAGRYLGGSNNPISSRTMQRRRAHGDGPPFIKFGRLVRYPKSGLDEYIRLRLRTSTSEAGGGRHAP